MDIDTNREYPLLDTVRTIIRLAGMDNIPEIIHYYKRNANHLKLWEPNKPEIFYTQPFWENQIRTIRKEFQIDISLRLVMYHREDNCMIGFINFVNFERGNFQSCRLGYSLDKRYEGLGYMFEGLETAIQYLFQKLNFHRVEANYSPQNIRSGNLLKRLGFQIIGEEKEYLLINGKWQNHILTQVINHDWEPGT